MDLLQELRQFDGKHVGPLEAVASRLLSRDESVDELLSVAHGDHTGAQTASTWILKWLVEQGVLISEMQSGDIVLALRYVTPWEAQLHLLQILGSVEIPSREAPNLRRLLLELVTDENKLIRAWSFNGLFVLADQHVRFRNEAREVLAEARNDPAPSVGARVRQIAKTLKWLQP